MEVMNCKTCRVEIEEVEARQSLSSAARAHTETCLPCRTFSDERRALRQLVGSLETVAAPPDFDFRLRARLAASHGSANNRRFTWPGLAPRVSTLALAASLVLLITAAVVFKQVNFDGTKVSQPTEMVATVPENEQQREESLVDTHEAIAPVNLPFVDRGTINHKNKVQRTLIASNWRPGSADSFDDRKFEIERNTTAAASGTDSDIRSNDFDVHKPSPGVYPAGVYNPAVDPNPSIIIPVRALFQPAKFLFGRGRRASQAFSLRNVTFGSEQLIEQDGNTSLMTSDASDIW